MNKRELAKAVAVQADIDLKTVTAVLDGFTDVVTTVVVKGRAGRHHRLRQVRQGREGGPLGP